MKTIDETPTVELFTVADVAKKLKVSTRLVYKLIEHGDLRCYRIASAIRISDDQLREYLKESGGRVSPVINRTAVLQRLSV